MVKNAVSGKELCVSAPNQVGLLSKIAKALADKGINILAVAGYTANNGTDAAVMLVTNDNAAAIEALKAAGCGNISEKDVIFAELQNKPGALEALSMKISDVGVDLKYIYGTCLGSDTDSKIVLSSADNQKALETLKA